jgi:hypothetical protein
VASFLLGREVSILSDYLNLDWYVKDARPHLRAVAVGCEQLALPNPLAGFEELLAGRERFSDLPANPRRKFEDALEELNASMSGG